MSIKPFKRIYINGWIDKIQQTQHIWTMFIWQKRSKFRRSILLFFIILESMSINIWFAARLKTNQEYTHFSNVFYTYCVWCQFYNVLFWTREKPNFCYLLISITTILIGNVVLLLNSVWRIFLNQKNHTFFFSIGDEINVGFLHVNAIRNNIANSVSRCMIGSKCTVGENGSKFSKNGNFHR